MKLACGGLFMLDVDIKKKEHARPLFQDRSIHLDASQSHDHPSYHTLPCHQVSQA